MTMTSFWPWAVSLFAYLVFLSWYVNWRGRVTMDEVPKLMDAIALNTPDVGKRNDISTLRAFLEADDGREFFMLNLVRIASGKVADPVTGEMQSPRRVMEGYTKMFLPALFRRGGHPAVIARKVGPYFDAWGVELDPGWTIMGYMRYRSRRDMAVLVADPRFGGAHDFKFAAMPQTFSFPTHPQLMALISPRLWVPLVLALGAALVQIALLIAAAP